MSNPPDTGPPGDETIKALREALRASPNNSALRLHFAQLLLGQNRAEEAEKEFREGLDLGSLAMFVAAEFQSNPRETLKTARALFSFFVIGAVASTWGAIFLRMQQPRY